MNVAKVESLDNRTPRSCCACLKPATSAIFKLGKTKRVDQSSRRFVCPDHENGAGVK